jgi:hypothetical protein
MISSVSLVDNNNQIGSQLWKKAGDSAARSAAKYEQIPLDRAIVSELQVACVAWERKMRPPPPGLGWAPQLVAAISGPGD